MNKNSVTELTFSTPSTHTAALIIVLYSPLFVTVAAGQQMYVYLKDLSAFSSIKHNISQYKYTECIYTALGRVQPHFLFL